MNIPTSIRVGGVTWKVRQVPPTAFDDNRCGDSDKLTQTIRINRDLPVESKELTLLHEWLHAVTVDMDHDKIELLSILMHQLVKSL